MSGRTVFISADLEGISGWAGDDESMSATRTAMARDVNAAIEGVLDTDPEAAVLVADAHGDKRTIPPDELHHRASLLRGGPRPYGMVDGVSDDTDVAFLIGYHDRPGTGGHFEHTFTGTLADVRLNGHSVGEFELNSILLADRGIPVALVSGDDRLERTVEDGLPDAHYVLTKTTRGQIGAICRHPTTVTAELTEAAAEATTTPLPEATAPVSVDPPLTVAVDYTTPSLADLATLWPGVERGEDSRTIRCVVDDIPTAYQFVRAAAKVQT